MSKMCLLPSTGRISGKSNESAGWMQKSFSVNLAMQSRLFGSVDKDGNLVTLANASAPAVVVIQ